MTASGDTRPTPSLTGTFSSRDYTSRSTSDSLTGQRLFKKHKNLPHPGKGRRLTVGNNLPRSLPSGYGLETDNFSKSSGSQWSIPSLRYQSRKTVGVPDLPPTPPVHSRNSSSSHSTLPSSPTCVASSIRSNEHAKETSPATPTDERTPPTPNLTPDRTPPGPADRHAQPRPVVYDRMPSKATTDSRTESFRTAPENPYSSEEEDGKSTIRPNQLSARSSQNTVRQLDVETPPQSDPQTVDLGLGLKSSIEDDLTPGTRKELETFGSGWGFVSEQECHGITRNVTVKKQRPGMNSRKQEVVEDVTVLPTNATKALRATSLQESPMAPTYPSRRVVSDRVKPSTPSSISESSTTMDARRFSGVSSKSTVSTVVEAILVDAPPQRRRTLRHVKKQAVLRDSGLDLSSTGSIPTTSASDEQRNQEQPTGRAGRENTASMATLNSISSRKARREIWKSGAIPVVVIPTRNSSVKSSSKEPSLRSTSSRRSKPSQSLSSTPKPLSSIGATPIFERPARRGRALSESDGSRPGDQRTMDYPPVVPVRSSSLSAPTSRNASRSGSLTAESLKAHNAFQDQQALNKALQGLPPGSANEPQTSERTTRRKAQHADERAPVEKKHASSDIAIKLIPSFESNKSDKEGHGHAFHADGYGDPFFGRRLSVQKTPFSLASLETTATSHAEVAEALAVNIYPHQNKSVLVVDHSNKPSESSSLEQTRKASGRESPVSKETEPDVTGPVTPPQPTFAMDDVDSPLRNPRAPPEPPETTGPPAIALIPATPSGLTPAQEKQKQLGNYFEETTQEPPRPISLLRRTFSRQRYSEYGPSASRSPGLLKRTFSLSKNVKEEAAEGRAARRRSVPASYPADDDQPTDENRLHPFWRPSYSEYSRHDADLLYDGDEEVGRYPPIDNRPAPRRSLSARMKRTFAILPIRDEYHDDDDRHDLAEPGVTAHRSIRRTSSGSLRVVNYRRSLESLRRQERAHYERPYTAPDQETRARAPWFWRSNGISRRSSKHEGGPAMWPGFLPGLGSKIDKYGLHNLPRRISEHQREKRSRELRLKISGPREVRDGVGEVIKRSSWRDAFNQAKHG